MNEWGLRHFPFNRPTTPVLETWEVVDACCCCPIPLPSGIWNGISDLSTVPQRSITFNIWDPSNWEGRVEGRTEQIRFAGRNKNVGCSAAPLLYIYLSIYLLTSLHSLPRPSTDQFLPLLRSHSSSWSWAAWAPRTETPSMLTIFVVILTFFKFFSRRDHIIKSRITRILIRQILDILFIFVSHHVTHTEEMRCSTYVNNLLEAAINK